MVTTKPIPFYAFNFIAISIFVFVMIAGLLIYYQGQNMIIQFSGETYIYDYETTTSTTTTSTSTTGTGGGGSSGGGGGGGGSVILSDCKTRGFYDASQGENCFPPGAIGSAITTDSPTECSSYSYQDSQGNSIPFDSGYIYCGTDCKLKDDYCNEGCCVWGIFTLNELNNMGIGDTSILALVGSNEATVSIRTDCNKFGKDRCTSDGREEICQWMGDLRNCKAAPDPTPQEEDVVFTSCDEALQHIQGPQSTASQVETHQPAESGISHSGNQPSSSELPQPPNQGTSQQPGPGNIPPSQPIQDSGPNTAVPELGYQPTTPGSDTPLPAQPLSPDAEPNPCIQHVTSPSDLSPAEQQAFEHAQQATQQTK